LRIGWVVLKADDRISDVDRHALASTGHLLILLLHDTTPKYISQTAKDLARTEGATLFAWGMGVSSYRAVAIKPKTSPWYLLAPVTNVGHTLLAGSLKQSAVQLVADGLDSHTGNESRLLNLVANTSFCLDSFPNPLARLPQIREITQSRLIKFMSRFFAWF
jgi:hypothetical protein